MASAVSPHEPVTAEDVLTMQFTLIKKGGYDSQEVDAFLDRVAATLDQHRGLLPSSAMTGDDVRSVEFSLVKRGGYATREVDDFLDRVVAVLSAVPGQEPRRGGGGEDVFADVDLEPFTERAEAPYPDEAMFDPEPDPIGVQAAPAPVVAAAPPPDPVREAPRAAPAPAPTPAPEPMAYAAPRLHDPEGAAQRLLAAAQQAADTLTADADAYATRVRREADDYAFATRHEADEHAERVTTTAESQAASIREVAADEARRVAEEARSKLVDELSTLEERRTELEELLSELEADIAADRSRLIGILDELRERVATELPDAIAPGHAGSHAPVSGYGDASRVDPVAVVAPEPVTEIDPRADDATAAFDLSEMDDDQDDDFDDGEDFGDEAGADDPVAAAPAETAGPSRSVFDLTDEEDEEDDDAEDWLDEEAVGSTHDRDEAPGNGTAALFDIEAEEGEPAAGDESPGPTAVASGDSFFDELRQPEEDALGPLDDDTDAALSAFFEADEDPGESRWRDRFGPGRN